MSIVVLGEITPWKCMVFERGGYVLMKTCGGARGKLWIPPPHIGVLNPSRRGPGARLPAHPWTWNKTQPTLMTAATTTHLVLDKNRLASLCPLIPRLRVVAAGYYMAPFLIFLSPLLYPQIYHILVRNATRNNNLCRKSPLLADIAATTTSYLGPYVCF